MELIQLDRILDMVIKLKKEQIKPDAPEQERIELMIALKRQYKSDIIEEIKAEYREELRQELMQEAEYLQQQQQIKDLKATLWSGFLLAFVVGLAVNQATDIITYLKGAVTPSNIWVTVWIVVVLCLLCVGAYLYLFMRNVLSLLKKFNQRK